MTASLTPEQVAQAILRISAKHNLNLPPGSGDDQSEMSWLLSRGMLSLLVTISYYLPQAQYCHLHVCSIVRLSNGLGGSFVKHKEGTYPYLRWGKNILTAEGLTTMAELKKTIAAHSRFANHAHIRFVGNPTKPLLTFNKYGEASGWWLEEVSRIQAKQLQSSTPVADHPERLHRL